MNSSKDNKKENKDEANSHDYYKSEGDEHTKARRFAKAEASYTQAISIEYTQHATWGNRSLVRLKLGNANGAAEDAIRCTELVPTWPKGWARLGAAERARNNIIKSVEAYRRAHQLEPGNKEFEKLLKEVLEIQSKNKQNNSHSHQHPTNYISSSISKKYAAAYIEMSNKSNYHMQMEPIPRLIPMRLLDAMDRSRSTIPSVFWYALDDKIVDVTNSNHISSENKHQNTEVKEDSANSESLDDTSASRETIIQKMISICLEQVPHMEIHEFDKNQQLALMMSTLENSPSSNFPELEMLMSTCMKERKRIYDAAKRIAPSLPIVGYELWCCSCYDMMDEDIDNNFEIKCQEQTAQLDEISKSQSKQSKQKYSITVAILNGPREGSVVGLEHGMTLDGQSVFEVLCSVMAFPSSTSPPPRRPIGVLLSSKLIPYYAIIARELLVLDIACRLESETEAENQRHEYETQQRLLHHQHHHQHYHQHRMHGTGSGSTHYHLHKMDQAPGSSSSLSSSTTLSSSSPSSPQSSRSTVKNKNKQKSKRPDKPSI